MKASSNVKAFELNMKKLQKLVPERANQVKRYIVLDLYNEITLGNPVNTGYSHANWNISNGSPNENILVQPSKGAVLPISPPAMGAVQNATLDEPTYITNSVGYVKWLEEGTSKMAPRHFIKRAMQIVSGRTRRYIRQAEQALPE